eukprot:7118694-Prymnesium_polylepis.1
MLESRVPRMLQVSKIAIFPAVYIPAVCGLTAYSPHEPHTFFALSALKHALSDSPPGICSAGKS